MTSEPASTIRPSFLRRHGLPMLLAAVVSSLLTAGAILGGQWYVAKGWLLQGRERLQAALLGRWELVESTDYPTPEDAEGRWVEFRPDGSIRDRSFTTVRVDGKVTSRTQNLQTFIYAVHDGSTIRFNPGHDWEIRAEVILSGDELTLKKSLGGSYAGVERYRRAK